MCTILIALRAHAIAPLVVAANRDELYARPTQGVRLLSESPRVIGGRDVEAGGTWFGLNEHGLFVGLTNRKSVALGRQSRGELVMRALAHSSVGAIDALLRAEATGARYRPFNLAYGNADRVHVAHVADETTPHTLEIIALSDGVHVLPSAAALDDASVPKVSRARALLSTAIEATQGAPEDEVIAALLEVLRDHWQPPLQGLAADDVYGLAPEIVQELQALCVHTNFYGTRSSAVLLVGGAQKRYTYVSVDGSPCVGTPKRVEHLLAPPSAS